MWHRHLLDLLFICISLNMVTYFALKWFENDCLLNILYVHCYLTTVPTFQTFLCKTK